MNKQVHQTISGIEGVINLTPIGLEEVKKIAALARIRCTAEELNQFRQDLEQIISYNISLLSEVDVTNIVPTSQTTGLTNIWRQDDPLPSQSEKAALSNAPAQSQQQFMVKKVLG